MDYLPENIELAEYLGSGVAGDLIECAARRRWTVRVPATRSNPKGYTEAVLATVIIDNGRGSRQVLLKATPPPQAGTRIYRSPAASYQAAEADCPPQFRRHLALPVDDPFPRRNGGMLLFQAMAADDMLGVVSLRDVSPDVLAEVLSRVTGDLLTSWNEGVFERTHHPVPRGNVLRGALQASLSSRGSLSTWAKPADLMKTESQWIDLGSESAPSMICPNPLRLALDETPTLGAPIYLLIGRSHGDLHLGNVLVPAVGASPIVERYQLIDLDGYSDRRVLTADPAFLLVSALTNSLASLPARQWDLVLDAVVDPRHGDEPTGLCTAVSCTADDVVRTALAGWTRTWRQQFLLSTLAAALAHTTFGDLGPKRRWWCFRLAARVGRALIIEEPTAEPIPSEGLRVTNSFLRPDSPISAAPSFDEELSRAWTFDEHSATHLAEAAKNATASGDPETVVPLLCALVTDCIYILGADVPLTLKVTYQLAEWTARAGDRDTARELHEDVWVRRKRSLGKSHPDTLRSFGAARRLA